MWNGFEIVPQSFTGLTDTDCCFITELDLVFTLTKSINVSSSMTQSW